MADEEKEKRAKENPGWDWEPGDDAGGHQNSVSKSVTETAEGNCESGDPGYKPVVKVQNKTTEHCMVCGSPLTYHEKAEELKCIYCGNFEHGHISCPNGHYICEFCHNMDSLSIIEDTIFSTSSCNPFEIAETAMSFHGLPMLGCQHAYIAGGALMAAIKNAGRKGIADEEIKEVFRRTRKQAHGGYCGLTGVCGIAPAIGACFAVLTGSKCGKDEEQRVTMEAVTRVSRAITEITGPSCCKAYVRTSMEKAVEYLSEGLGIELPLSDSVACNYSFKHPHGCRETRCPFFEEKDYRKKMSHKGVGTGKMSNLGSPAPGTRKCADSGLSVLQHEKKAEIQEEKMETLLKRALELGADKAKIIDPATIVVEEWVRWKCQYGCQLYEKDAYHPPCAPPSESAKKVVKEYCKAILMNGPKGKELTEAAVRLEGEAYRLGYYKAFALTALSSGPAGSAWPSGEAEAQGESQTADQKKIRIRPLMEACGIDVFKTARAHGFEIDTKKETYGRWNYFALLLIE